MPLRSSEAFEVFTNECHNQTGDNMKHEWQVDAPIMLSKSVLLGFQKSYYFDGHNIHIWHKNWEKICWNTAYVTNDKTYPRMWILVEDKLVNAPVIIS